MEPRDVDAAILERQRLIQEQPAATWGDQPGDAPTNDTGETFRLTQREARMIARAPRGAKVHVEFHHGTGRTTTRIKTRRCAEPFVFGYRANIARSLVSRRGRPVRQVRMRRRSRVARAARAHAPPRRDDPEREPEPPERVAGFTLVGDLAASELSRLRW